MNVFDIVILVFLLYGFIKGIMKGLFVEIASLVALIGGIWGAIHFSYFVGDFLEESVTWSEKKISLVAFAITFVIIIVVVGMLGKFLTKLADLAALGLVNKILGGIFGFLKIGLVLSIVFIFFHRLNATISFVDDKTLEESVLYNTVKSIAPAIFPSIINTDGDTGKDVIDSIIDEVN
ncbi:MAG: CvpA family protein [Flavobacteriaceae bacterium]|nr:CvpA family protein [Flavobacteriaceae bacterium]